MDGNDEAGLERLDGFDDGLGFRLTEGARATIESMSRSGCSPIISGEIAIAIDAINVLAGTFGQTVGVGLRENGYGSISPDLGVVPEKTNQTVGQLGAGGLGAVDAAKDEDGVGAKTEDGHNQRFALDGVAESYGADGCFVSRSGGFKNRWDC